MPDDLRPPPESAQRAFPILWSYDRKERIEELQQASVSFMPICVPWAMLVPHEQQAQKNHSQILTRLAERGGLSPCEALAILDDRDWKRMPITKSCAELSERIAAWNRPAALTINPDDPKQVAVVVAQIESVCSDGNSAAKRVARDVLVALKALSDA